MKAGLLKKGDVIGLVSPSHIAAEESYEKIIAGLEKKGFRVKTGRNLYRTTWGFLASTQERADDFNEMIADDEVAMIFFGGGTGSVPLLPLIDYETIRKHPKLYVSYSDGTSILNAIWFRAGVETFYGQTPGLFESVSAFDDTQFVSRLMKGGPCCLAGEGRWRTICRGTAEGILIGGYLENVALEIGSRYFNLRGTESWLLFLEDHERFHGVAEVDMYLSHIEQNEGIKNVSGLLFGHYTSGEGDSACSLRQLLALLERFGKRHGIPVAYCDDFGHGDRHALLPVGRKAWLDADRQLLQF